MKTITAYLFPRKDYRTTEEPARPLYTAKASALDYLFNPECNTDLLMFFEAQIAWDPTFCGGSEFFSKRAEATKERAEAAATAKADLHSSSSAPSKKAMDLSDIGGAATDSSTTSTATTASNSDFKDHETNATESDLKATNEALMAQLLALQTTTAGNGSAKKKAKDNKRRKTGSNSLGSPAANLRSKTD